MVKVINSEELEQLRDKIEQFWDQMDKIKRKWKIE